MAFSRPRAGQPVGRRFPFALIAGLLLVLPPSAAAQQQEEVLFPAIHDAQAKIVEMIYAEQVRLDIATWYLNDGDIAIAIVNKHRAGVPVRVIGDRGAIFEADANTRGWFEYLASNGVPIRLRYHPRWAPLIMHWKCGIFKGQGMVEFGSANWTTFELKQSTPSDFKDETALFSDDPTLVNAFLTKFDQMWADTSDFLDWKDAYQTETGQVWTPSITVNRSRLEPDHPDAPGMIWEQGTVLTNQMLFEINRETQAIDMVVYRLTIPAITDALIAKHRAGVRVRVFVEPTQYRNKLWPEYELTGANIDQLWTAGIEIKQRQHVGLMHMKTLITSNIALNASSNFTENWERDHNYFISRQAKLALWTAFKNRFNDMWNDGVNYVPFQPQNPDPVSLQTPGYGAVNVPTTTRLEWSRASWATSYDVYLGTSSANPDFVGTVTADMTGAPRQTYSFTPPQALQPNTAYYWRVVSKTYAGRTNTADFFGFTTAASGGGGGSASGPFGSGPVALPGLIEAENFDNGGANVAYFDTASGNAGGTYRNSDDVDIEGTMDTGGGYNVGWIATGEWLKYTVNVSAAGTYTLEFRVACAGGGGTFHVEGPNGENLSGPVSIDNTGGWQTWTTVTKTGVTLSAGQQVWTVRFDAVGTSGAIGNLNWIRVASGGTPPPPPAVPTFPGTVQAEDFDTGPPNVAYVDSSTVNEGGQYRLDTGVDIEGSADSGGGYNIGWAVAGEWLRYTVNVTQAGTYDIEVRVASPGPGGTFHIAIDGVNKTGTMTVENTNGWQSWTTVRKTGVALSAGQQIWQLVMETNGSTNAVGNFNWIRVVAGGSSPPPPLSAPEIVIYGSDVTPANVHGNWARVTDATAAGSTKIASVDGGAPTVSTPFATPADYFEATFDAVAGVRYRLWLRLSATSNNKFNDSVWVQFSGSTDSAGSQRYRIGTGQALNVNLATCSDCALSGWGWQNRGYWEPDTGEIWFSTSGPQTIRIQIREDGVAVDQIVLSPQKYVDSAPGGTTGDNTIVPKS